ncbi:acyltransferase domain-containing protein [Psychromicrobium sp. YIM B11713]|uniref:acyltransferase domain-containing protein n=1 Tax=Psychromicrobium sp. YIM B11713 TaxID=3145233 RepID=UPI00374EE667
MDLQELLAAAAIQPTDRQEVLALLEEPPSAPVLEAMALLRSRLGLLGQAAPQSDFDEFTWMSALLRFLPEQFNWYQQRGIPSGIALATTADIGRQIAISRVTTGGFGLETWKWLTEHATGTLYQLGRLQFQIQPGPREIPGLATEEAILGLHIPEIRHSPITPGAVQQAISLAKDFFNEYFSDQPVRFAHCISWLLDPYLLEKLPTSSNIVQFASLFTLYGQLLDTPSDAVYFTFRSRDSDNIQGLPRETLLQRVVLERIEHGDHWRVGQGYLKL